MCHRITNRWTIVAIFCAAACVTLSACSPAKTITVTDKDDNATIRLARGDTLNIRLESNPSTGYSWQIAQNDTKQLQPIDPPDFEGSGSSAPGAGGYIVFHFKAQAEGKAALALVYVHAWEKKSKPAETYHLTVQIDRAQS